MGCIHSKSSAVDDSRESPAADRVSPSKHSSELKAEKSCDALDEKLNDSDHHHELQMKIDQIEKLRRQKAEVVAVADNPRAGRVPKAAEGEQVAAGWPAWLSAVAGEAINGWLPRKANTFEKLDKIGQGTYSSVYRARDVVHNKIVALKKVRFDNMDPESVKFMCREIMILRRLDHPNVIKLESIITAPMSCSLYLVFEYMEHDLTGLAARPGIKFTEPQIKCYMKQLLSGLDHCHKHDILHRDIKGSNLLINNNGVLKIADFGLANLFDQRTPLTSRVVTLWYRPPELLMGASRYGVGVDMWSTGCILGELYTGNPILPGKTEVEQLHKIFKLCGSPSEEYWKKLRSPHAAVFKPPHPYQQCITEAFKELPPAALGLMETLLSVDPTQRGSAALALNSEFFTTSPVACDTSSLPKYPPSKEIDVKLREEARRRREAQVKEQPPSENEVRGDFRSNVGYNPTNEQIQGRNSHSSSNTRSEIFGTNQDKATSGYLVGPRREPNDQTGQHRDRASFSGPLISGPGLRKGAKEHSSRSHFPTFSGLLRGRKMSKDNVELSGPLVSETQTKFAGQFSGPISGTEPIRKRDRAKNWMRSMRRYPGGRLKDDVDVGAKDSTMPGHEYEGNRIYVSGPLLVSSNNVDRILKDHDRRIQEHASLYLVFEYMEHDLTGLAARPGIKFTEPQIKCYMKQLLSGLDHCHKHDILHRDIKGSNLLINNNGVLKIADFGLANFFDQRTPLTSRVVTLWYRPPELLMGASRYGVGVDMWSTGCILGELYTGNPILPGKTEVEQLHKIFKLCGSPSEDYWKKLRSPHTAVFKPPHPYQQCITEAFKELPPAALGLMETLLSVDPTQRGSAALALSSEFFTTGPVACDTSSLPKYPPSKEIDVKLREEARRRREAQVKEQQPSENEVRGDFRLNVGYNSTNEQIQGRNSHSSSNTRSEIFGTNQDKATSGYLVGPRREPNGSNDQTGQHRDRASFSGPLVSGPGLRKGAKEHSSRSHFPTFSGLLRGRKMSKDNVELSGPLVSETQTKFAGQFSGPISGTEPIRKRDRAKNWMRSMRRYPGGRLKDDVDVGAKDSTMAGHDYEGNRIYVSGPLLVSSNNVDRILKDHDRRIQEHARRVRTDKPRVDRDRKTQDPQET